MNKIRPDLVSNLLTQSMFMLKLLNFTTKTSWSLLQPPTKFHRYQIKWKIFWLIKTDYTLEVASFHSIDAQKSLQVVKKYLKLLNFTTKSSWSLLIYQVNFLKSNHIQPPMKTDYTFNIESNWKIQSQKKSNKIIDHLETRFKENQTENEIY